MSVHSASADHLTTEPIATDKRSIGLWDVTRLLTGLAAGVVFIIGVVDLIKLSARTGTGPLTQDSATDLSVAIVMTVCGLAVSWLAFAAQRSVDRRAEHQAELAVLVTRATANAENLSKVIAQVEKLATEVHDLLTTEQGQQQHSAKARADVAKIQEDVSDLRLGVAEMAQRMPTEESLLNHLKAYIDTLFAEFRKQVYQAAEDSDTAGYLRGMHGRVNGSRPHLHAIDSDR